MRQQITTIAPIEMIASKLRVAAYVRVSTDKKDQLNSFAAQYIHYKTLFSESITEELAGIYSDEGISGTSTANREDFKRMIADCEKGKIDRIYTKSVSRFARNTSDCLKHIRHLKSIGVTVYFEKENLDTALEETELRLTLIESHAQEESISISKNVRLGEKFRMENGEYQLKRPPYGYDLIDHKLVINEKEATVVRRIFHDFVNGKGITQICRELNEENIPRNAEGTPWNLRGIGYILKNEKYIGDQHFVKRYRTETLPFKRMYNHGEMDSYYIEECHEPIIEKEIFYAAQELRLSRRPKCADMETEHSPLQGKIICGKCGATFRKIHYRGERYWGCGTYNISSSQCNTKKIPEAEIHHAFITLYNKLKQNKKIIIQPMIEQLVTLKKTLATQNTDFATIDREILLLGEQLSVIAKLKEQNLIDEETYRRKNNELNHSLNSLRSKRRLFLNNSEVEQAISGIKKLSAILDKGSIKLETFDETIFNNLVENIIADDSNLIQFKLVGGLTLREIAERKKR